MPQHITSFDQYRERLFAIAYRMLGTRVDAEDIVQEAYLRWHGVDAASLHSVEAWLVTVTTRLCIDRLRAVRAERARYVGPWLPEPLVADGAPTPEQSAELAGDISTAFLLVLERLAPEERAAFLLREVFDIDYEEIADMLGKNTDACRQIVHRAKTRVRAERPRFNVSRAAHVHLLESFIMALQSGNPIQLKALFAEDVRLFGDGGGKVLSALRVLEGAQRLARFYEVIQRNFGELFTFRLATVNGEPGILRYIDGELDSVFSFLTDGTRILEIYALRNPDKLRKINLH